MKKSISFVIIFLLVFPTLVSADGMVHIQDPDMNWRIHDEKQQFCVINYENGYQNMILAIDIDTLNKDQKGVWIFPVPASPDRTVIDIVREFPNLWGSDVEIEVDQKIFESFSVMRLSQIYTFPSLLWDFLGRGGDIITNSFEGKSLGGTIEGVTIHEYIEKYGVVTELVSTKNGEALYKHLLTKGLNVPEESKEVIEEYVGDDYSFVISWFSGYDEIYESNDYYYPERLYNTVGVSLTFPTDKIYYPLKPTSVYGSKRVPTLIYVMGYVTPNLYPEIQMDSEVTYFIQNRYYPTEELKSFFGEKQYIQNLKYTKIKINPPSKYLTKDLWIENYAPTNILMDTWIIQNQLVFGVFFFVLSSFLASVLSGFVIFRRDKPSLIKIGLFGLWNFLTIIGFSIATLFMKTKKLEPEIESKLKSRGLRVWDGRKIPFIILFSISFIIITILFQIILGRIF